VQKLRCKRKLIYVAVVAALGVPLTTLAAEQPDKERAQQTQQQGAQSQSRDMSQSALFMPATKLMGMDIKKAKGNEIGEIQDLMVDINNNRVHYAIVDAQGKKFAYPLRVFKFTPGKDEVQLNVSEDRLERAPGMKDFNAKRGIVDPALDPYWREVDSYWGQRVVDADKKTAAEGDVVPGKTVKVEPRSNMQLAYASNLVGWNIENRTNNDIGEIEDLMINVTNGKVHFAVVDFNRNLAGGAFDNNLHALP
jgi:sporulation protein YlmC with PRC-barrel domain